jgi:peptide/nickel transport system substrate-binding protein
LAVTSSRVLGVLVTAGLLAVLTFLLRPTANDPVPVARSVRGGQVVAAIRDEPRTFNPYVGADDTSELLSHITQARLIRVNRSTFEVEPWLAEAWESSPDGRTFTFHLRPGLVWSDNTPFSSVDVLFSLRAVYDQQVNSPLGASLMAAGQRLRAAAPDASTVVVSFSGPSGPGLRLLDRLPILPKHKLEASLLAGTFASMWDLSVSPGAMGMVGMGPFLVREYHPGERLVLDRNPRYWRTAEDGSALPYLDRLVLQVVADQDTELLHLQMGEVDLGWSELRSKDYVPVRRLEEQGRLRLIELGVASSADAFWFCLAPEVKSSDPRFDFVQRPEFRHAISHAIDREALAETVFGGLAVPVWGPVTPGNSDWFWPDIPRYPPSDERARELLKGIGLEDRNGNGVVETADDVEARFTVLTERGVESYERGLAVLTEELGRIGIALETATLESDEMTKRMLTCDYDAMYYRPVAAPLDPAWNLDFWLSSGSAHFWHRAQRTPATDWERRIDTLMLEQAATLDAARRREQFNLVQRIMAENLPVLYFAAPRMYYAHNSRVQGITPSVLWPPVLWSADTLSVSN